MRALEEALTSAGWSVTGRLAGDDYRISGAWQIERGRNDPTLHLDFEGMDDMVCLPMERAYGCRVRNGKPTLYFARKGRSWSERLREFVQALNEFGEVATERKV
ncbi:MAG TPA: hypothetical protein VFW40_08590 [Capsulimonadaceae bacterium]|nr:hypothetical protein [Capsulimonadaceae bacterium]